MSIRAELASALSNYALDNAPTAERQEKSQFSVKSGVYQVRTIAERLYAREDLTEDEWNACQQWQQTYILLNDGPGAIQAGASRSEIKHDKISFTMEQALRKDSIPAIREFVGKQAHALLVLSLYECLSASNIASLLLPDRAGTSKNMMVDQMCKYAYQRLNEFYILRRNARKNRAVFENCTQT